MPSLRHLCRLVIMVWLLANAAVLEYLGGITRDRYNGYSFLLDMEEWA